MKYYENSQIWAERDNRFLHLHWHKPHRVLSTCAVQGGMRDDLSGLLNAQCCEASAEHPIARELHQLSREELHTRTCREAGMDAARTAMLATAANMDYASLRIASYQEVQVTAIVTAGVEGNAGRAGDAAQWHEGEQDYVALSAKPGTINVLLHISHSLSPAAYARAVVTLTEAKSAALQELAIPSRYSPRLATGTGTDQFAVAAPCESPVRFHHTGLHAKLGELIGWVVREGVREALRWQNGLEASRTRSLFHALGRFGLTESVLRERLPTLVRNPQQGCFLLDSIPMVAHDPRVGAQAHAMACVLDRIAAGALPESSGQESILWQAALLAASVGGAPQDFPIFLERLRPYCSDLAALVLVAIEQGWSRKWS